MDADFQARKVLEFIEESRAYLLGIMTCKGRRAAAQNLFQIGALSKLHLLEH